jgi:hypothetical protein
MGQSFIMTLYIISLVITYYVALLSILAHVDLNEINFKYIGTLVSFGHDHQAFKICNTLVKTFILKKGKYVIK